MHRTCPSYVLVGDYSIPKWSPMQDRRTKSFIDKDQLRDNAVARNELITTAAMQTPLPHGSP